LELTAQQKEKLEQARALLIALGLPKAQCNEQSGLVFLASVNVKYSDRWVSTTVPLLPTVKIVEFIYNEYGINYKPCSDFA